MKKHLVMGAVLFMASIWVYPAQAQFQRYNQNNNGRNNRSYGQNGQNGQNGNNGAVLPLPRGVNNVISIDAHNIILAEVESEDNPDETEYKAFTINHVYSGGIARVLGGTIVPTEVFVSPAFNSGGANGVNNGFNGLNNGMIGQPLGNPITGGNFGPGLNPGFNPGYGPGNNQGFNPGFNQGYNNPGFYNQSFNNGYYNPNFNRPTVNVNYAATPRQARATRQLQRVMNMLDKTPRMVAIGP